MRFSVCLSDLSHSTCEHALYSTCTAQPQTRTQSLHRKEMNTERESIGLREKKPRMEKHNNEMQGKKGPHKELSILMFKMH